MNYLKPRNFSFSASASIQTPSTPRYGCLAQSNPTSRNRISAYRRLSTYQSLFPISRSTCECESNVSTLPAHNGTKDNKSRRDQGLKSPATLLSLRSPSLFPFLAKMAREKLRIPCFVSRACITWTRSICTSAPLAANRMFSYYREDEGIRMKWHMYIQRLSRIICAKVVYTQESNVPFLLHENAAWPSRQLSARTKSLRGFWYHV